MTSNKKQIGSWVMGINWGIVQDKVETILGLIPDQESIQEALEMVEADFPDDLYTKEAEELEELLIHRILKILRKKHGREIKKIKSQREKEKHHREEEQQSNFGVQVLPFGDLKDMDIDPKLLEQMSKGLMDQLFGRDANKRRRNKKDEEDDDEEDPGASFYM